MNYLILSLKWSKGADTLVWWRENDSGYTARVEDAGRYTPEQVAKSRDYYDNGTDTIAVPESVVKTKAVSVVPAEENTVGLFKLNRPKPEAVPA